MAECLVLSTAWQSALVTVGAATLACFTFKLILAVLGAARAFFVPPYTDFRSYGQWAVVTGSTDGIGKAYAEELAAKNMDIVLVSRSAEKLRAVSSVIETSYKVKTKVIAADFSMGAEIYSEIGRQLAGLDIGVLVNNVAASYDYPEYFHLVPRREEKFPAMLNCNMLSVTEMTGVVLPHMLAKKRGIIINVSSSLATFHSPLYSVYSATKSYVSTLTRMLQAEYGSQGIRIQLVEPFGVVTNMSKLKTASFVAPAAASFVREALGTVGVLSYTNGCFSHWLQGSFLSTWPVWLKNAAMWRIMLKIRRSALLKAEASKND